jgi:hypothetical protein
VLGTGCVCLGLGNGESWLTGGWLLALCVIKLDRGDAVLRGGSSRPPSMGAAIYA